MSKGRKIVLAVPAKVLDDKHCSWACPALEQRGGLNKAECMRLWKGCMNTPLRRDSEDLPPLRCKACRDSEIKE